jgi:ribose transport system substrate-binding protein
MRSLVLSCLAVFGLVVVGCQPQSSAPPANPSNSDGTPSGRSSAAPSDGTPVAAKAVTVAFVTNGIASFWDVAEKGAKDAATKFGVSVDVRMPPNGAEDQKRMMEDLLVKGVKGIAVSPIDPENQHDLLESVAEATSLITHDSDAPKTKRLCYVGIDNYTAGRKCGQLVKEALPNGGSIMIFVGRLEQANARLRRQGLIDELLDRTADDSRYDDPSSGELKGEKYTVLDTRTDEFDNARCRSLAQDSITKYPDLGCMVGLFAYNPPLLLEAVRDAGKLNQIQIVAFDEDMATLSGIAEGSIHGTVVQDPYHYGFESVRILAGLSRGDQSVLPPEGKMLLKERLIRKDNVQEFRTELEGLMKKQETPDASAPSTP